MSNVAPLRKLDSLPPATPALSPATVVEASAGRLRVELHNGSQVDALLALAFPYAPNRGDTVLIIGSPEGHYVIGVIQGTGESVLTFPGDAELRSLNGVLRLAAGKGVEVEAPRFSLVAHKMQVVVEDAWQRFGTLKQTVSNLLALRAGEMHTIADGAIHQQSKRTTILTEEKVCINGKAIHLG